MFAYLLTTYGSGNIKMALGITFYLGAALSGISVFFSLFENDERFIPEKFLLEKYMPEEKTNDNTGSDVNLENK